MNVNVNVNKLSNKLQERERERERMYQAEREHEQDMLDRQERAVSLREREQRATMLDLEIREREMKLLQQKKNVDCEREQADEVSSESDDDCEPNLCDPSVDVVLMASSWMVLPGIFSPMAATSLPLMLSCLSTSGNNTLR
jgi:hypothetical protein